MLIDVTLSVCELHFATSVLTGEIRVPVPCEVFVAWNTSNHFNFTFLGLIFSRFPETQAHLRPLVLQEMAGVGSSISAP